MKPIDTCTYPGCSNTWTRNKQRKTTMCRRHATLIARQDPDVRARTAAACRKACSEPGYRERMSIHAKAVMAARLADPVKRERLIANARQLGNRNAGNLDLSPEQRKEIGRRNTARRLEDIPVEYRDDYRDLRRRHNLSADERRQIIAEQVKRDTAKHMGEFLATGRLLKSESK